MKNYNYCYVFILLLHFSFNTLNAQSIGNIKYVVETDLLFDDLDGITQLQFQNQQGIYKYISFGHKAGIEEKGGQGTYRDIDRDGYPIYIDLQKKHLEQKYQLLKMSSPCIIIDTLPDINWKIYNESKELSDFTVYKAVGKHGGRFYEAWFTYDIPVGLGPHYLHGLPGLILEAKSIDGMVSFSFKSFEMKEDINNRIIPLSKKYQYPAYSYAEYLKAKKSAIERLKIFAKSMGGGYEPPDNSKDWQIVKAYF